MVEKSDLENLFVNSVEEVRKAVMRRRIQTEIVAKKKVGPSQLSSSLMSASQDPEQAQRFEETLERLVQMAKGKVRYEDFTRNDKFNLIDLFVNNEKVLMHMHDTLFA